MLPTCHFLKSSVFSLGKLDSVLENSGYPVTDLILPSSPSTIYLIFKKRPTNLQTTNLNQDTRKKVATRTVSQTELSLQEMTVWNWGSTNSNPPQIDKEHFDYCFQEFFLKDFNPKFRFEKEE